MPSTSPGTAPTAFAEILPGTPAESLQAVTIFVFRFKRYIAYISGQQLNILSGPSTLVQALTFPHGLIAVAADAKSGKLLVAGKKQAWILEPVAEGWTRLWWEKTLLLRHNSGEEETWSICWSNEGEALLAGNTSITLFSTLPTSRTSSPRTSAVDDVTVEERRPLWSKPVARPVQQAACSPSSTLIATRARYDRLVKIWRRLSFEEGLFDHTYLPHPAVVTHFEWRPLDEHSDIRRGSAISRRHDEEHEVLFTVAADGVLRIWRTGGTHELDVLVLRTSIDLVAAIPDSPSISASGKQLVTKPPRCVVILPSDQFSAALNAAIGLSLDNKISHAKELMKELVSKELDVIIVLDGQGRMSAWGLHSIGHKRRPGTPTAVQPFHIAHTEGLPLRLPPSTPALPFAWFQDDNIHMLMQSIGGAGQISWWQGLVESFFSTSASGAERLELANTWRGTDIANWKGVDANGESAGSQKGIVSATEQHSTKLSEDGRVTILGQQDSQRDTDAERVVETGITNGVLLAANTEVAVLLGPDDNKLLLVDILDGYVEHCQVLDLPARSAQCVVLGPRQSIVAIAHDNSVDVFAQGKYKEGNDAMQSWYHIRRISVAHTGLDITGLAWRSDGTLAVTAGTALFVADTNAPLNELQEETRQLLDANEEDRTMQLPSLASQLSRPFPVWHPTTIERLVLHGHTRSAVSLVKRLASRLKFWGPGDDLDFLLDEDIDRLLAQDDAHNSWIDKDVIDDLKEQLEEKHLPAITRSDQRRLEHVLYTLLYLRDHVKGLDQNALWYLFSWKLQLLLHEDSSGQANGNVKESTGSHDSDAFVPEMSWREITFAYHSSSQQPLLDILILHHDNKLTWDIARRLGIMSWLTDREALLQVFEQMAQTAYRSSSPPDPVNAAVYYLALHKKQTLLALWRIATWHREQRSTTNFLKKDFSQPDARTAAKKNAYALMGKRRFHYAAAFFLLADDAADACNVLAGQCDDVQFAVSVARLYSGDGSDVLHKLLVDRVIPDAKQAGNRWLVSWCHSVLLEKREAAESLVEPIDGMVKTWEQDDPALILLYKQLRKTPSEHEPSAVARSATILGRMGLPLLATDLTKNWTFAQPDPISSAATNGITNGFHASLPDRTIPEPESPRAELIEPPSLLDSFTRPEPTRSTSKDDQAAREAKAAELLAKIKARKNASAPEPGLKADEEKTKKREPTQFKEPDANSLLDSFGF
ncbi:hypothetical protein CBER1_02621 [Cercospora berteroae]|uniref:RAVE complex protein Rav1 C-terminal domain-containing protein n=1 Tax=Cercospora berteroae TaxID=357750 RepID=A0A2S6CEL5_9PEZI|nr:hypothetical protein CBER1_02621 [Cercospora berteroae]